MGPVSLLTEPRLLQAWLAQSSPADPEMLRFIAEGPDAGDDSIGRLRDLTDAARRRHRRDLTAAVEETMAQSPPQVRLGILSLVLLAVEAGCWDSPLGDGGWIKVLSAALENLDRDDVPASLGEPLASWAALATYLIYDHRPASGSAAESHLYEKAVAAVAHLFPDASATLVARYAKVLTNSNGGPVDPEAVLHVAELAVQDDPLADAINDLASRHPGWDVHKHAPTLLHVDLDTTATLPRAAEALDAIPEAAGTVAVLATGTTMAWTIAIRTDGTLIHVDRNAAGTVTWRQYRLGPLTSPTRIARDPDVANRSRVNHGPLSAPFPAALQALTATGFELAGDPPSSCP